MHVHCALTLCNCALSHVSFFRLRTLQSLEILAKPGSGRRRRQGWSTGSQVLVTLNLNIAKCICPNRPGSRNHKFIFILSLFSSRSPWAFSPPDHPEMVAADATILDVGCGNGLLTVDLAKEGFHVGMWWRRWFWSKMLRCRFFLKKLHWKPVLKVVGVDYCAAAIKLAKQAKHL